MNLIADATLPGIKAAFPDPFRVSFYSTQQDLIDNLFDKEILICRSTLVVDQALIAKAPKLRYIATASSGSDHINQIALKENDIRLIDAKGCNASAVADYVVSVLAFLKRTNRCMGNDAGIVGYGAVGIQVAERLKALGYSIKVFDPLKAGFHSSAFSDILDSDLICIHANLHNAQQHPSFNLFDEAAFKKIKPNTVIINASRGGIVNEAALTRSQSIDYCTDVYADEPAANPAVISRATLCTPHIAGHSIEAKINAIELLSNKIHFAYQLQPPLFTKLLNHKKVLTPLEPWPNLILTLYNPDDETQQLKSASDKLSAFIRLRKAHTKRNSFSTYQLPFNQSFLKSILG